MLISGSLDRGGAQPDGNGDCDGDLSPLVGSGGSGTPGRCSNMAAQQSHKNYTVL